MVHGIQNISIPNIAYTMTQGNKMSLPVDSSSIIYSNFEHVSGTPAPEGTEGISISKLKLLDVLIEQLDQVKKGGPAASTRIPETSFNEAETGQLQANSQAFSPFDSFDILLESFNNQIRQAKEASAAMPYIPSPSVQAGAVFNLVV